MTKHNAKSANRISPRGLNSLRSVSGQVVATIAHDSKGTPYLKKRIKSSRHALRTPPGLAIDRGVLDQARRRGCVYVEVHDLDTGTVYRTNIQTFDRYGFAVVRGFGEQVGLTFGYWDEDRPGPGCPAYLPPPPRGPVTVQGDLFGGAH